jgi:hypothetical protein
MKAKPTISVLVKPIHIKRNKHQLKMLTSGRCVCVRGPGLVWQMSNNVAPVSPYPRSIVFIAALIY